MSRFVNAKGKLAVKGEKARVLNLCLKYLKEDYLPADLNELKVNPSLSLHTCRLVETFANKKLN